MAQAYEHLSQSKQILTLLDVKLTYRKKQGKNAMII